MDFSKTNRKFFIGIIDDHKLFAQSLKELLLTIDFIDEVKICTPPNQFGFKLPRQSFHLIFMDISIPHIDGFELFKQIKQARPYQKIAFLSSNQDKLSIIQAKKIKANGYLFKSAGKTALTNALSKILFGNTTAFPVINRKAINSATLNTHDGIVVKSSESLKIYLTLGEQKVLEHLIKIHIKVEKLI